MHSSSAVSIVAHVNFHARSEAKEWSFKLAEETGGKGRVVDVGEGRGESSRVTLNSKKKIHPPLNIKLGEPRRIKQSNNKKKKRSIRYGSCWSSEVARTACSQELFSRTIHVPYAPQ